MVLNSSQYITFKAHFTIHSQSTTMTGPSSNLSLRYYVVTLLTVFTHQRPAILWPPTNLGIATNIPHKFFTKYGFCNIPTYLKYFQIVSFQN